MPLPRLALSAKEIAWVRAKYGDAVSARDLQQAGEFTVTYTVLNESMIAPGRAMEAEAISQRLFELQGRQSGYQRGVALASMGIPNKYIRASQWASPAAYLAYARSAALTAFLQANPTQGIVTASRLEGFETVTMHSDPGTPSFAVLIAGNVAPGKAAAFEQSRNEGMALIRASGLGMITSILARSLANQSRYVVYHSFLQAEALQRLFENPQFQAWRQQHAAAYWASGQDSIIEQFEVVMVHAPVPA